MSLIRVIAGFTRRAIHGSETEKYLEKFAGKEFSIISLAGFRTVDRLESPCEENHVSAA